MGVVSNIIRLTLLATIVSVILGSALITARTSYEEHYNEEDGNYYIYEHSAYPKESKDQRFEEEPSFLGWIVRGIRRFFGFAPSAGERQGPLALNPALIFGAVGLGTAGLFRNQIANALTPTTTPAPAESTTPKDPCLGVECSHGETATSSHGICQCRCGTSAVSCTALNPCQGDVCTCGTVLAPVTCSGGGADNACIDGACSCTGSTGTVGTCGGNMPVCNDGTCEA